MTFFLSVESYSSAQQKTAQRLLDSLDHCDARLEVHYDRLRVHERKPFRGLVKICVPILEGKRAKWDPSRIFQVWGRSLSRSGLSFIYPGRIREKRIVVGLDLPNQSTQWFHGEIVRERGSAMEEFREYGVQFRGRASEEEFEWEGRSAVEEGVDLNDQ